MNNATAEARFALAERKPGVLREGNAGGLEVFVDSIGMIATLGWGVSFLQFVAMHGMSSSYMCPCRISELGRVLPTNGEESRMKGVVWIGTYLYWAKSWVKLPGC